MEDAATRGTAKGVLSNDIPTELRAEELAKKFGVTSVNNVPLKSKTLIGGVR